MILGIDASRAAARGRTGTETYAYHLIHALIPLARDAGHTLRLYFNAAPAPTLFPDAPGVERVVIPLARLWTHARLAVELRRRPPDVFFTPAHVIPLSHRGPSVATVHDLGYERFPEAHPATQRAYLRWSTRHNARRARVVLADSEATRADLIRLGGTAAEKIAVVYPGVDPGLAPVADPDALAAVAARYAITPPYLLYLGTLQPRKNLSRLVAAYAGLPAPRPQLVLAGRAGWLAEPLLAEIERLDPAVQASVRLPGFVAEADKAALLSGAVALLFPSLYEGFGFPVLEAQACGTPVLTATNSSLPEVAGDAAVLVEATDTAAIRAGIARLVADPALRQDLVRRGQANVRRFTWEAAARQTLAALDRAAGDGAGLGHGRGSGRSGLRPYGSRALTPDPQSPLRILSVPIHPVTMAGAMDRLVAFMGEPRLHQVATPNPEFVMAAQRDPTFLEALQRADLCIPDGIGLVLASRWYGRRLPARVPGSELVHHLAGACAIHGWRLFLLGAAPGVAEIAAARLVADNPGLVIAGTYAGSPDPAENDAIVARINGSQPDVLYVAYGAPRQDLWIARNRHALTTVRVAIGVGGALDFIAGRAVRAPRWLRRLGLEWFYRLLREPWRWRRMLALPHFAWAAWRESRRVVG